MSLQNNQVPFTAAEIKIATGASGPNSGEIRGVRTDSREVSGENLFVPLKGERFDAHDFLETVKQTGAQTLSSREADPNGDFFVSDTLLALGDLAKFHRTRFELPVIGITGSYGKTSTRALAFAALSAGFHTLTSAGNFNNEIGLPLTLFALDESHEAAVLEMGMRGLGQIHYLAQIAKPTIGIITNIGPQHIELLGSEENIALAKSELISALPQNGLAILPADSPFIEFLKSKAPGAIVLFGQSENAHFRVLNIQTDEVGNVRFSLAVQTQPGSGQSAPTYEIQLPMPGAHNALNAAAAFAAAYCLEIRPEAIVAALENATLPGARMRVLKPENGLVLIDDCYNAGPDSMRAALHTLLDFPGSGRRVAVLGAMKELGEFSEAKHREIGALAGSFCDILIGVGGETRPLLNAAIESARQNELEIEAHWCESAGELSAMIRENLRAGDVVLVKGSRSVGLEKVVEALNGSTHST